jgi:simple sugar transport system ATP-binding protein
MPGDGGGAELLRATGVCKFFPGVKALDGVDFTLRAGEIHALLGENGAGKSTLVKVITGVQSRDAGAVTLGGLPLDPAGPADAQRAGIACVYQEVNLLPNLSVADNLFMGRGPVRFGLVRRAETNRRARALLKPYALDIDVAATLSSYSIAVQQLVAIARAVDLSARVLILDEPTASLDADEVAVLFRVMRDLRARGIGIVFVTHFLDQVYAVSDRMTVLRNGKLVGSRATAELPRIDLVTMMLGKELVWDVTHRHESHAAPGVPKLSVRGLGRRRYVAPLDLDIGRGEVVGVAGLLGSGRTETATLLFGTKRADGGTLAVDGKPVRIRNPHDAIRHGFGFCPEDRKMDGIAGALSVRENIILALQSRRGWRRRLPRHAQDALASRFIRMLDIRTPDAEKPIQLLSGGNQQKAILARWLAIDPQLLILDEPTRGIDVGAHAEIVRLIERLCGEGMSLYVISSELDEIVAYSDRVMVMRDRRQAGVLEGADVSVGAIMAAIAHVAQDEAA